MSLAKTLAKKFKISKAKVFATNKDMLKAFNTFVRGFKISTQVQDVIHIYGIKRSKSSLNMPCRICGTLEMVEMHHVKHIRKEKTSGFTAIMTRLNRKQISVCRSCHMKIHKGLYDGISLKDLSY